MDKFFELNPGPYTIDTYGRVYRSNGPTFGWTGRIGGIPREFIMNHVNNRTSSMTITDELTGSRLNMSYPDTRKAFSVLT